MLKLKSQMLATLEENVIYLFPLVRDSMTYVPIYEWFYHFKGTTLSHCHIFTRKKLEFKYNSTIFYSFYRHRISLLAFFVHRELKMRFESMVWQKMNVFSHKPKTEKVSKSNTVFLTVLKLVSLLWNNDIPTGYKKD